MLEKKERIIIWAAICISAVAIIAVVILARLDRQSTGDVDIVYRHEHDRHREQPSSGLPTENTDESAKADADIEPNTNYKLSLSAIIWAARTWKPIYTYWFGREAPDLTLTDINGKNHTLSDYHGKNVMVIFWATWCGPCIVEVPHLIALRNLIGEDELAMLAISYRSMFPRETTRKVRNFVKRNKINYTVFSTDAEMLPIPFSRISGIPTTFFIDKQGKIKLATEGVISLGEIKAILRAE